MHKVSVTLDEKESTVSESSGSGYYAETGPMNGEAPVVEYDNNMESKHKPFNQGLKSLLLRDNWLKKTNNGMHSKLPISQYHEWFNALVRCQTSVAVAIMESLPAEEFQHFINTPFDYEYSISKTNDRLKKDIYLAFHIAVAMCSKDIVQYLIDNNANVLLVDKNKCNVLHACIIIAFRKPDSQQKIIGMIDWLLSKLNQETINELFYQENSDGLRPVEFAAQQGCLLVLETLLQVKSSMTNITSQGFNDQRYHDVTEYELGSRKSTSPIDMLPFLDKSVFNSKEVCLGPITMAWIQAKINSCKFPIIIWFLIRLSIFFLFYLIDSDKSIIVKSINTFNRQYSFNLSSSNRSSPNASNQIIQLCNEEIRSVYSRVPLFIISVLVIVAIIVAFVTDIILYVVDRRQKHKLKYSNLNGVKSVITSGLFYSVYNSLTYLVILTIIVSKLLGMTGVLSYSYRYMLVMTLLVSIIPILMLWSFFYFIQMIPYFGSSVISLQGMHIDLLRFSLLFSFAFLPFIRTFQNFVSQNTKVGCIAEFSSFGRSTYTMFQILLSQINLTSFDLRNIGILYGIHVIFTFLVIVMFLNFLIAIMSNKANEIAEMQLPLLKLNQLSLVVQLENRLHLFMHWVYKCSFLKRGFHRSGDKIYLVSVGNNLDSFFEDRE